MSSFNKKIIEKNFSAAAKNYDELALVQKITAKNLCDFGEKFLQQSSEILDLGSGTSFVAKNLWQKNFSKITEVDIALEMLKSWRNRPSQIKIIQADIENLPAFSQNFDAIFSSFSMQWVKDFDNFFTKISTILQPKGIFIFALPNHNSLHELRKFENFSFNDLPKNSDLKTAFTQAGFKEIFFTQIEEKQFFQNGLEALKYFKKIGANHTEKKNFLGKKNLQNFNLKTCDLGNKNFVISWSISYFILRHV